MWALSGQAHSGDGRAGAAPAQMRWAGTLLLSFSWDLQDVGNHKYSPPF